jgi:hypothetical protein
MRTTRRLLTDSGGDHDTHQNPIKTPSKKTRKLLKGSVGNHDTPSKKPLAIER